MRQKQWKDESLGEDWWRHVSGPKALIKAVDSAADTVSAAAVSQSAADAVFLAILKERLENRLGSQTHFGEMKVRPGMGLMSIAEAIGSRYKPDWIPDYKSPFAHMARAHVLRKRVLFLWAEEGADQKMAEALLQFQKEADRESGHLFLICPNAGFLFRREKVPAFEETDFITPYDIRYFALQCVKSMPWPERKKQYVADLAARLSGTDATLCERLAVGELYTRGAAWCQTVAEEFPALSSLANNPAQIVSVTWEAQITLLLPLIEHWRLALLHKYREDLTRILSDGPIDDFGKKITRPDDMELRHLWYYFVKAGAMTPRDTDIFQCIYNARNDLAHLQTLSAQRLDEIFGIEMEKNLRSL